MEFDLKDLATVYAAVLSTIVFVWNMRNSKPKFSVEIVHGVDGAENEARHGIFIFIKNPSLQKVHIESVALLFPTKDASTLKQFDRNRLGRRGYYWNILRRFFKRKYERKYAHWVHTHLVFKNVKTALPVSIESRNSHRIFVPEANLKEMLSEAPNGVFAAMASDALWRRSYSAPFAMYYK